MGGRPARRSCGAHRNGNSDEQTTSPCTAGTPSGKVTLHKPGPDLSASLSGGKVTFKWTPGTRGTFQVYATYFGDPNYCSATSAKPTYKVT